MAVSVGKLSVHNPVLVNIVMGALLVLGVFSLMRLPREQFSDVPFYWVIITVAYPGVSAEDIEQNVTSKIEEELDDLPDLDQIVSTTREGLALLRLEFREGISSEEFERDFQRAQTELSQVDLPEDVLEPRIEEFSSSDFLPVVEVVLSGEVPYGVLDDQAELLRDRMLQVPGISSVDRVGSREREVRIAVDRTKAEALGISLDEIAASVRLANASVPAGNLTTPSREYVVRTVGELTEVEQFERLVVRKLPTGQQISIDQLATVRDTFEPSPVDLRYNGDQAISLQVVKTQASDAIRIVERIEELIAAFAPVQAPGVEVHLFNDSTLQIRDSLNVLIWNAASGFLLLVIVLFAFLGLRNALVTALGIPLTFSLTFIFMEWYGESLNGNSLFALVLVLGLIVDHAILIVENSYRYRQQGLGAEEATVAGADEVVAPILSATLTTVAAFLPLMLVPGTIGKFLRIIPIVASFALAASMLEAFFFLPAHFTHWGTPPKQQPDSGLFGTVTRRFEWLLRRAYDHKVIVGLSSVGVAAAILSLLVFVRQDLFSGEEYSWFYIDIELAPGSPREATAAVVSRYEEELVPMLDQGEASAVSAAIGYTEREDETIRQNNVAQIRVDLVGSRHRAHGIRDIMLAVRDSTQDIAGTQAVRYRMVEGGPPVEPPVSFRLFSDNYDDLRTVAREYRRMLSEYDILYNVTDELEQGKPQLQVFVDNTRAAQAGLSVTSIGSYLRAALDGIEASTFYREDDELDVVVSYDPMGQNDVSAVTSVLFPRPEAPGVPFSSVASASQERGIAAIKRVDGRRQVQVSAEATDQGRAPAINEAVQERFAQVYARRYPGMSLEMGGEFEEFGNILEQVARLFLVGLFLMYLILGTQFSSYSQPLLIIFSIPFAFSGVVLYLLISGSPFSTIVMYAGVALAGVAVNDAIVSISFINSRQRDGMPLRDAVIEAASVRLRPIVLTTITTMAGLLPMAIGIGGRSPVWGPMASTIIFGLLFSTLSTLVIMPCWYGIFERVGRWVRRKMGQRGA